MPTFRKLHVKIIDSFDFAEMPNDFTRVFWMLLIVVVDSEGRAIDNHAWLRARMFPLRSDVQDDQLEGALSWLNKRGMIVRYQVNGRGYFYVTNFKNYQSGTEREAKSTLPAPKPILNEECITPEEVKSDSGEGQELVKPAVSVNVSASASDPVYASVFKAYENEIGTITETISKDLSQAIEDNPPDWIIEAMQEASRNNARSWKYVSAILKRWKVTGKTLTNPTKNNGQPKKTRQLMGANGETVEVEE